VTGDTAAIVHRRMMVAFDTARRSTMTRATRHALCLLLGAALLLPTACALKQPQQPPRPSTHGTTQAQHKARFFASLRPIVQAENARIAKIRQRILRLHARRAWLSRADIHWLGEIARTYRMNTFTPTQDQDWRTLLRRVDEIPLELVLAQAANESAWGTSRFAREGNNYFGQWCYRKGCGIVPKRRAPGAHHEVARFRSVAESVASYMHNLNTLRAYRKLRMLREAARAKGEPLDAEMLAEGLVHYSARGHDYVRTLQAMIRKNRSLMRHG